MTELKTLKEIEFEGLWKNKFPRMHAWKTRKILKKEAIKWVNFKDKETDFDIDDVYDRYEAIDLWIKHFFNITEEELK